MNKQKEQSLYSILGVKENATEKEIKLAHAKKIKETQHPDKIINDPVKKQKQTEILSDINKAYSTLSDSKKREQYDAQRFGGSGSFTGGFSGRAGAGFDFSDFFEDAFGGSFGTGRRTSQTNKDAPQQGADIAISLTLSFKEFVHGSSRQVTFNYLKACSRCSQTGAFSSEYLKTCVPCNGTGIVYSYQKNFIVTFQTTTQCTTCGGSGKMITKKCQLCNGNKFVNEVRKETIKIPRGIRLNEGLRLTGLGNDGYKTRMSGDLTVEIKLEKDSYFERRDYDLYANLPISFLDSVVGDYVEVLTTEGIEKIKVPIGTQSGDTYLLKGKGFYRGVNTSLRGDFIVRFEVKFPKNISQENKEIFARIKRNATWNPNESFIKKRGS